MSVICMGIGTARMGRREVKDGKVISEAKASWEPDPKGGSVAIWPIDPDTMEATGPADVFGDWDAAGYLKRANELLEPTRQANIPNFPEIIKRAMDQDGIDLVEHICEYCGRLDCRECIVEQWKEEAEA